MPSTMYLVNPASDFITYFSADVMAASGFSPRALTADLPTVTLAALAPPDFNIAICDENISPINFDHSGDWIGITGKGNQRRRITAVASEFRRRGKQVIIGGPYASFSPATTLRHTATSWYAVKSRTSVRNYSPICAPGA